MTVSICHVSDSQQRTASHVSRLTVMEPQFIYQKQRWASFVHRGSSWAACKNALCTTAWTTLRTPHQYKRLLPSTAANRSSIYSDHYSKNPSTIAANDIFHYASVRGPATKLLMDVILLVNTFQALTIHWCPTKTVRQMFLCLIVFLGSHCQRKWTQHRGDGEARGLALLYCILTPFERAFIQCAKYNEKI